MCQKALRGPSVPKCPGGSSVPGVQVCQNAWGSKCARGPSVPEAQGSECAGVQVRPGPSVPGV